LILIALYAIKNRYSVKESLPMFQTRHNILPFFKISFAYTAFYLFLLVIFPLFHLVFYVGNLTWQEFFNIIIDDRVMASYKLTFSVAFFAALINITLGLLISWTIVKYKFFGKSFIELLIDLPLALPTAIAGLTLATLYSPDTIIGQYLAKLGIQIAFTNAGIMIALIFVGLPLAIRTIEPVIREFDPDVEAAAYNLGANGIEIFRRVYLPNFAPAILSAFSICFARALSEYGAVIFIASNIPKESEIASLLIYSKIEQFDYNQATAIALVMLSVAFFILWFVNLLAKRLLP
jgi:sulfate/thiosulfate transport system permease protein